MTSATPGICALPRRLCPGQLGARKGCSARLQPRVWPALAAPLCHVLQGSGGCRGACLYFHKFKYIVLKEKTAVLWAHRSGWSGICVHECVRETDGRGQMDGAESPERLPWGMARSPRAAWAMTKRDWNLHVISHIGPSLLQRMELTQPQGHWTHALGNSDTFSPRRVKVLLKYVPFGW